MNNPLENSNKKLDYGNLTIKQIDREELGELTRNLTVDLPMETAQVDREKVGESKIFEKENKTEKAVLDLPSPRGNNPKKQYQNLKLSKTTVYLIAILIITASIRIFSAYHLEVGTDEMIYTIIPLNIINSGRIGTVEQSPLFFYLNDLSYKLFGGLTAVSARFWSIIFGTAGALIVFMLSKELFNNNKMALLSAFLFGFSGYIMKFNIEMDLLAFFLLAISMLHFIKFLKEKGDWNLLVSALFLSLAISVKILSASFIPGYLIAWIVLGSKNRLFTKKKLVYLLGSLIIGLLILSPIIIFNYLTFTEKGITDYYVSNVLGIGKSNYGEAVDEDWSVKSLQQNFKTILYRFLKYDWLIFIFGVLGVIQSPKDNKTENRLIFILIAIYLVFLLGKTPSSPHYLLIPLVLSIYSGYSLISLSTRLKKSVVPILILALIFSSLFILQEIREEKNNSVVLQLREFVYQKIEDNAIVVIDPRIYYGIDAWVFNDKHYFYGINYPEFVRILSGNISKKISVPIYYIECSGKTYCGWKPEPFAKINPFAINLSNHLTKKLKKIGEVKTSHELNIYSGSIYIAPFVYSKIDLERVFWSYSVGWKFPELAPDYYEVAGIKKILHNLGLTLLWISVTITILTIPALIYFSFKQPKHPA